MTAANKKTYSMYALGAGLVGLFVLLIFVLLRQWQKCPRCNKKSPGPWDWMLPAAHRCPNVLSCADAEQQGQRPNNNKKNEERLIWCSKTNRCVIKTCTDTEIL
jgi:hypothetical protein